MGRESGSSGSFINPKGPRKSSYENNLQSSNSQPSPDDNLLPVGASSKHHSLSVNRPSGSNQVNDLDSRQKVMAEKERRKKEEEDRHMRQLDQIRQDNVHRRQEAIVKQQALYRPSN